MCLSPCANLVHLIHIITILERSMSENPFSNFRRQTAIAEIGKRTKKRDTVSYIYFPTYYPPLSLFTKLNIRLDK